MLRFDSFKPSILIGAHSLGKKYESHKVANIKALCGFHLFWNILLKDIGRSDLIIFFELIFETEVRYKNISIAVVLPEI